MWKHKITEIVDRSMYREWKTIHYLYRLDSTIHKEKEVLENQWGDGRSRFRSWNGPV